METRIKFYMLALMILSICAACDYDNYDTPDASFTGNLVYQGQPLNFGYDDVYFQLWEPKYDETPAPINVYADLDGSFSAMLFSSSYKLVFPGNPGPFLLASENDTTLVNVKGSTSFDIEVIPYYLIENPSFSASGRTVTANFDIQKVITDGNARDIERVNLYLNKTTIVDDGNNDGGMEIPGGDITDMNGLSISLNAPEYVTTQNYIYARIGLKIQGVEDMIFSPVEKLISNN